MAQETPMCLGPLFLVVSLALLFLGERSAVVSSTIVPDRVGLFLCCLEAEGVGDGGNWRWR